MIWEKSKMIEYRKKHPRCRYCEYLKKEESIEWIFDGVAAMDRYKIIRYYCPIKKTYIKINAFKGCFCKIFKPREDDIDI